MIKRNRPFPLALALLFALPAMATSILPVNLVDLAKDSERIFEGTCTAIEHTTVLDRTGQLEIPATRYTFKLIDALKGVAVDEKTVTLSQLGKFQDGRQFLATPEMLNLPGYKIGETYLLFIDKKGVTGLASPIGMPQGVFAVKEGVAANFAGNRHILAGMETALTGTAHERVLREAMEEAQPAKKASQAGVAAAALKALVRDLLNGNITAPSRKELMQ